MPTTAEVSAIEVVEDFTAEARCDEGFLRVQRLRCRNLRLDGSRSGVYRVDVVDRPKLDAVAVILFRQGESGLEVMTRQNLRPAAYFRAGKATTVPDGQSHLWVEEIVAGLLEPEDRGEAGLRHRAAEEAREEGGIAVSPDEVLLLGAPFFLAPGILSEKVFPTAVDVTGKDQGAPQGDGSPLEEGGKVRWWAARELLAACRDGRVQDAKTELALVRLLER
jgi:ADP-ribose pyrophosphatase